MDSRGFARAGASAQDRAAGWWGLVSLLALGGAFVALIGEAGTVAAVLGLAGAVGLGAAILLASSEHASHALPAAPDAHRRLGRRRGQPARARRHGVGARRRATAAWCGSPARSRGRRCTCCPRSRWCRCSRRRSLPPPEPRMSAISFRDVSFAYPDAAARGARATSTSRSRPASCCSCSARRARARARCCARSNGLVPHSSGGRFGGDVVVFGRSTRSHHPRELADVVGFVAQDPESQFVVDHVERDLAFVLENLGFSQEAMRRRVEEVLDALGIAHLRDRDPSTLSGGERQRCAIAGALAAGAAGARARRADVAARPAGRRRRARRARAAQRRPRHDGGARRAPPRARRAARRPRRARRRRARRHARRPSATCSPTTRARRASPGSARLLGWDAVAAHRARRAAPRAALDPPTLDPPAPTADGHVPGDVLLHARATCASSSAAARCVRGVDLELRAGDVIALLRPQRCGQDHAPPRPRPG